MIKAIRLSKQNAIALLRIILAVFLFSCTPEKSGTQNILVVVAHPDDETAFGSALAKHARLGDNVYVIFAVDAKFDTRLISAPPDSLLKIKQNEVACSCEKLRINKPIFFSFNSLDRKHGNRDGVRDAVDTGNQFKEKFKQTLADIQPDLIITFGPDGEYGHPEHIVVGSLVTELLLREGWVDTYPLYYFGWTKTQEADGDGWVRYADDQYFNTRITYTDEDEQNAMDAIQCYASGFTQKDIEEMIAFELERKNELYFRRFIVAKGLQEGY
ncbi:MAG: PIG-L family deacetylase [Cyclobacteriaceae bacterium]